MKAMVYREYGAPDVLQLQNVEKPIPKDNEVLIKVHATTVTSGDARMRSSNFPRSMWLFGRLAAGLTKPKQTILGSEMAGEIIDVGTAVKRFKVGERVFGAAGLGSGTYTEYICLPEDAAIAIIPSQMSYEESAAIPVGAHTAMYFLQQANIQAGQKVLIYGASGSMGTYAVQLAKDFGAEVTGVCSTSNKEMVKSIGADHVIDYTQENFTQNGILYDVIFDTVGKTSFSVCKNSLTENGIFLAGSGGLLVFFEMAWTAIRKGKKVIAGIAIPKTEDMLTLKELIETQKIKPIIDKRYTFEQLPEAHGYVDKGHKKGNVVIQVSQE